MALLSLEAMQSRVGIADEAVALSALRERHKTDPLQSGDDRLLRASILDEALAAFDWNLVYAAVAGSAAVRPAPPSAQGPSEPGECRYVPGHRTGGWVPTRT